MKRHLPTILLLGVVLAILVGLNAVFLAQPASNEDERTGDRSSYSPRKYGTMAFFTLLKESGHSVRRVETDWSSLESSDLRTLFIIWPKAEHQPTGAELAALQAWIFAGGHAIVMDREIELTFDDETDRPFTVSTSGTPGQDLRPAMPTALTRGAASIKGTDLTTKIHVSSPAALTHFEGPAGSVVVDVPVGLGRVTFASETHFVENGGIAEADNVALALNLARANGGPIGFDEFHHGYGKIGGRGGIREYISGTPLPYIIAQIGLVALVIAYGAGRRFGRAVPLHRERRTSNLEFVTSMANVQRLAKANDLAIENIYGAFRLRLCRFAGVPAKTPSNVVAAEVARRARLDARALEALLRDCDDVLAGVPKTEQEVVALVGRIREQETALGLRR